MRSFNIKEYTTLENRDALIDILDQVEEGVFWVDFSGRIIKVNKAAVLKTGYSQNELPGMEIFELSPNFTISNWYGHVDKLSKRRKASFKQTLTTKSGKFLPVSVKTHIIENGGSSFICAVVKDIKKSKEERNQFQRVLYEYDKLIYRLSHDLRSPISTILGLVNLAKKDCTSDQNEYMELIEATLQKQNRLMMNVHHLSTIHTTPIHSDDVNFPDLVNDIVGGIPLEKEEIDTKWSYRYKLHVPFFSDHYLISKILSPIIENAVQFGRHPDRVAKIRIAIHTDQNGAHIVVKDNGTGIDAIIRDKVFEMFFRGSSESKGSGLGLYIARIAANKLRAKVNFKTSREGTAFEVFIPHAVE